MDKKNYLFSKRDENGMLNKLCICLSTVHYSQVQPFAHNSPAAGSPAALLSSLRAGFCSHAKKRSSELSKGIDYKTRLIPLFCTRIWLWLHAGTYISVSKHVMLTMMSNIE